MNYIYSLLNTALNYGIGVELDASHLQPDESSWSKPELKYIMVNMNVANQQEIPFQFAHEIGHILNGDASTGKLLFSSEVYSKSEYNAHHTGIKLLLPLYLEDHDEPNYIEFMNTFVIPARMTDVVIYEFNHIM